MYGLLCLPAVPIDRASISQGCQDTWHFRSFVLKYPESGSLLKCIRWLQCKDYARHHLLLYRKYPLNWMCEWF